MKAWGVRFTLPYKDGNETVETGPYWPDSESAVKDGECLEYWWTHMVEWEVFEGDTHPDNMRPSYDEFQKFLDSFNRD